MAEQLRENSVQATQEMLVAEAGAGGGGGGGGVGGWVMCLEATVEKKNISRVLGPSQAFQVALVVRRTWLSMQET